MGARSSRRHLEEPHEEEGDEVRRFQARLRELENRPLDLAHLPSRRVLGRGGFGQVDLVEENGQFYALKKVGLTHLPSEDRLQILNEVDVMVLLSAHQSCFPQVYGKQIENEVLYILMEYLPGKRLLEWRPLLQNWTAVSLESRWALLAEISVCLGYLHHHGVAHRDLKPENIIADQQKASVQIIDFGLSCLIGEKAVELDRGRLACTKENPGGTPGYIPPEVWEGRVTDPFKIDVYALGYVGYFILTGLIPREVLSLAQQNRGLLPLRSQNRAEIDLETALYALLWSMVNADPQQRPDLFTVQTRLKEIGKVWE